MNHSLEWTAEDARRWCQICDKSPDELTSEETVEGQRLAERALILMQMGIEVPGVVVLELVGDEQ